MLKLKAMKKSFGLIIILTILFLTTSDCQAIVDPTTVPNNRFGIHIVSDADLENAADLVNGNGGQWGYISLVIRQDERNTDRWRTTFNKMNRLKLIPIVRIATTMDGSAWAKPTADDANIWAAFLDSLPWPTKNRYVSIFNEPNHANEWGGQIDPKGYTEILKQYSMVLKNKNEDFFILSAGLDASAKNIAGTTMDEIKYLNQMQTASPDWLDYIDGWSSHSYPQPNFQGSASATGRGSIRTFDWEINELKKIGLSKDLPIFITETGWRVPGYSRQQLDNLYISAFNNAWNRSQIVAVTPFLLNYQSEPFADFSWQILGHSDFYPFYYTVSQMPKIVGKPTQLHRFNFINQFPAEFVAQSHYNYDLEIENTGQSIINKDDFDFKIATEPNLTIDEIHFDPIYPGEKGAINLKFHTGENPVQFNLVYWLQKDNQPVGDKQETKIKIYAFPDLHLQASIGLKNQTPNRWFKLFIYDLPENTAKPQISNNQTPIREYDGSIDDQSQLLKIQDIIFGKNYLLRLKVFNGLPKDIAWTPQPGLNEVKFGEVLSVDFNNNNYFDIGDIWEVIKQPLLIKQIL